MSGAPLRRMRSLQPGIPLHLAPRIPTTVARSQPAPIDNRTNDEKEFDRLVDDDSFIDKVISASLILMRSRRNRLANDPVDMSSIKDSLTAYQQKIKSLNLESITSTINAQITAKSDTEFAENINNLAMRSSNLDKTVIQITKRINELCGGEPNEVRRKIREGIKEAVSNLRQKVGGSGPDIVKIRRNIEDLLVKLAYSWSTFNNSYVINYTLLGGAGVGKTTLAEAIAKCMYAFGLISSPEVIKAEKPDLVGQYVGQTAHLTNAVLYRSLEKTLFIDEAYALVGDSDNNTGAYGKEAIAEIINFTPKFQGHLCFIVAGYKKDMDVSFFSQNEGLRRRFPTIINMKPYPIEDVCNAIVSRIVGKDGKYSVDANENTFRNQIEKAVYFIQLIIRLIYLDTTFPNGFDDYFKIPEMTDKSKKYNFFENNYFNLAPIVRIIYFSQNVNRRNIMKAYIMKYILGIKEFDIFPNQMGDIQNICDIIMTQDWYQNPTRSPTIADAINIINSYMSLRSNHKIIVLPQDPNSTRMPTVDQTSGKLSGARLDFHFCTNGLQPSLVNNEKIMPLLDRVQNAHSERTNIFGIIRNTVTNSSKTVNIAGDLVGDDYKIVKENLAKLYTEAVRSLANIFLNDTSRQNTAVPGYLDIDFLEMENQYIKSKMQETQVVGGEEIDYMDLPETKSSFNLDVTTGGIAMRVKDFPKDAACQGNYNNPKLLNKGQEAVNAIEQGQKAMKEKEEKMKLINNYSKLNDALESGDTQQMISAISSVDKSKARTSPSQAEAIISVLLESLKNDIAKRFYPTILAISSKSSSQIIDASSQEKCFGKIKDILKGKDPSNTNPTFTEEENKALYDACLGASITKKFKKELIELNTLNLHDDIIDDVINKQENISKKIAERYIASGAPFPGYQPQAAPQLQQQVYRGAAGPTPSGVYEKRNPFAHLYNSSKKGGSKTRKATTNQRKRRTYKK